MLVFSRKKEQSIMVGDNIEIVIINIGRETVKLGINAPKEVTIHRKEVFMEIEKQNREAAISSMTLGNLKDLLPDLSKKIQKK